MTDEQDELLFQKVCAFLDEATALAREAREHMKKPFDWTLLYGPRGTEIRRPGPEPLVTPPVEIGWKP